MFMLKELLGVTNGKLLKKGAAASFSSISTDSRNITKGCLFVPIVGKNFDGHDYIDIALKKGAAGALTSSKVVIKNSGNLILVKDTLVALHLISKAYKNRYKIPFVGVTGSSGKTTTKDMLASILSLAGKTLKTEENFNNEIGVPKTLLNLNRSHKYAVIEMAMQGLGEIKELSNIVEPDVSIITNIGASHMEFLKSEKNVAKAKSEIMAFQNSNDISVLPADDKFFGFLRSRSRGKVVSFGIDNDPVVSALNIRYENERSIFAISTKEININITLPVPGKHNIYDALAAAAAALALKVPAKFIKKGLEHFKLSSKRSNIINTRKFTLINDTYNANPDSMAAALNVLENYPGRRIAVLGDMFELGNISKKSHENIGKLVAGLDIDALITVGKLSNSIASSAKISGMKLVKTVRSNKEAVKTLKRIMRTNDTILIKGSRGMRMEEIVEGLIKNA
jgi:UDP-N-acetylmuramoyl-tripeptide--D-alanyl-D-alanine ligase